MLLKAPYRQWVVSFPWPLRLLFAARPQWLTRVLGVVTRTLVRAGVLVAEAEQPYLDLEMDSSYEQLAGAAIR